MFLLCCSEYISIIGLMLLSSGLYGKRTLSSWQDPAVRLPDLQAVTSSSWLFISLASHQSLRPPRRLSNAMSFSILCPQGVLRQPNTEGCAGRLLVWFYGEQSCMWVAPDQMELLGSYQDLAFGLRMTALRHWGRKQLKCALLLSFGCYASESERPPRRGCLACFDLQMHAQLGSLGPAPQQPYCADKCWPQQSR